MYDALYQAWLRAKQNKNYTLADRLRGEFERLWGLTIIAEGMMPIEGATVKRMRLSNYIRKYGGNREVARFIDQTDSNIKSKYRSYGGLLYYGDC